MAPIVKEPEQQNAAASPVNAAPPRVQPVALEISVTVNGVRTVEGSDKREPFSETTQTVLVFGTGAVIRLNSGVASGQLLFLTNEKTKKEVVCQVVKSKNYRSASGYVELEFTEPAVGFWGMRFPTDRVVPTATPTGAPAVPAKPASVAIPAETKAAPPVVQAKPAVIPPAVTVAPPSLIVPPPAPVNAVPAVEAKAEEPETREVLPPMAPPVVDSASEELKRQTARLQEQLSSMLFAETLASEPPPPSKNAVLQLDAIAMSDATAKIFEIAAPETGAPAAQTEASVAPWAKTPELSNETRAVKNEKSAGGSHEEEVKIPSWLEPLARNAATSTQSTPPAISPAAPTPVFVPATQPFENAITLPAARATVEAPEMDETQVAGESYDFGNKAAQAEPEVTAVFRETKTEPAAPSFDRNLFGSIDTAASVPDSGGSKKGLWIGAIAATVLIAAGGGWWYMQQNGHPSAASGAAAVSQATQQPAGISQGQQTFQTDTLPQNSKTFSNPAPVTTQPSGNATQTLTPATVVQKIGDGHDGTKSAVPASAASRAAEPVAQPADEKKSAFKQLRLAAPTVKGGKTANLPNAGEPGIAMENANSPSTGTMNLGLGGNSGPKAPITVGGEVSSAQPVSSVPPVYPSLARAQRISGDVKIDAFIDENGRVTGMKVVSGPVMLQQAAMDALRQWRYKPAMLNGSAVSMHLLVTIQFRLQ